MTCKLILQLNRIYNYNNYTESFMFSIFKKNPTKKLNKLLSIKLEQAMHAQRNGDIRTYSQLSFEADQIDQQIAKIEAQNTDSHLNKN